MVPNKFCPRLGSLFVAHELDQENRKLLEEKKLSFVLHHDLGIDLQNVLKAFVHFHKLAIDPLETTISHIQVTTPQNISDQVTDP